MKTENNFDVSVIGLGKLGASMLAAMASRGLRVTGCDISPRVVDAINQGLAPVRETNLGETIQANKERIRATLNVEEAVHGTPVSFIVVPTPSDKDGSFSLQYAAESFASIGRALASKNEYHVVVLTSTVLPGSTRYKLLPILEKESGKMCGKDFGLCYNPEFIALGSVIKNFLNPDFYLLGEFDSRSGDALAAIHNRVSSNRAPIRRMSLENAELAKIAINSYVTLKISYANMLADICERLPGGDIDVVSGAVGTDSRIGRKYLTGGLGFGGPCFPRDNSALVFLGERLGVDTSIVRTNDTYNRQSGIRIYEKLKGKIPSPGSRAAVLGLSYKPFSHVVEESGGVFLCKTLSEAGYAVCAYDPLANEEAALVLTGIEIARNVDECLKDADVVFVTTPDPAFMAFTAERLCSSCQKIHVVDFWRCLKHEIQASPDIVYIPGGRNWNPDDANKSLCELWREK
ncbi:MAG: nucleotide sugar dehydrogenase [Treponema sp.]|jgi:UDPglucose 6-dehydrogenase|nr:nucleotide sugar dehydrogenase [Treponema sp.]